MTPEEQKETTLACPHCGGRGANQGIACGPGRCQVRSMTCSTCKGTGRITPERQAKIDAGEALRRDRIARDMSQREEAKQRGLDVVVYSQMERGIYDGDSE